MHVKLSFPFKGTRNYVHGTSIFEELEKYLVGQGFGGADIDLAFRHMMLMPDCVMEVRPARADDSVVAKVSLHDGGGLTLCLNSDASGSEVERVSYDENEICKDVVINGSTIVSLSSVGYSDVEMMVALCKRLHQEYFDTEKRWVFSRFKGRVPLAFGREVELRIVKCVGTKLTCSEVFSSGQKVGEIYFS